MSDNKTAFDKINATKQKKELASALDKALFAAIKKTPGKRRAFYESKVQEKATALRTFENKEREKTRFTVGYRGLEYDNIRLMDRAMSRLKSAGKVEFRNSFWFPVTK